MEYVDEMIDKRILIRYAGDAKFKGVRSSLPVYEVDLRGPAVKRMFTPWRHAYVTERAMPEGCVSLPGRRSRADPESSSSTWESGTSW